MESNSRQEGLVLEGCDRPKEAESQLLIQQENTCTVQANQQAMYQSTHNNLSCGAAVAQMSNSPSPSNVQTVGIPLVPVEKFQVCGNCVCSRGSQLGQDLDRDSMLFDDGIKLNNANPVFGQLTVDVTQQLSKVLQRAKIYQNIGESASSSSNSQQINDALAQMQQMQGNLDDDVEASSLLSVERAELETLRTMFSNVSFNNQNIQQYQPDNQPELQNQYVDQFNTRQQQHNTSYVTRQTLGQSDDIEIGTYRYIQNHGWIYYRGNGDWIPLRPQDQYNYNPEEQINQLNTQQQQQQQQNIVRSQQNFGLPVGESSIGRTPTLVPKEVKIERPMTFGGKHSELQNFLFVMKQYIDTVGLGDEGRACRFLVSYLKDDALTWWRSYSDDDLSIFDNITLDELIEAMEKQFTDIDREIKLRDKILNLKQLGTVANFVTQFKKIQLELGKQKLGNELALHCFVSGLKPYTRQQVHMQRPVTLEEAMELADRCDQSLFWLQNKQKPKIPFKNASQYSNAHTNGPSPMVLGTLQGQKPRDVRDIICHHCVVAKKLILGNYFILNNVVQKADEISLLCLNGSVLGRSFQFLLDSGASWNFVGRKFLDDLEIDYDLVQKQDVRLADGKMLTTCGKVELKIKFGKFLYIGSFLILKETIPLILGMNFFQTVQPVIDWSQKTVGVCDKTGQLVQLPVTGCGSTTQNVLIDNSHVVEKSWPSTTLPCKNQFDVLPVEGVEEQLHPTNDVDVSVVAPVCSNYAEVTGIAECKATKKPKKLVSCLNCEKKITSTNQFKCSRCLNISLQNCPDQLQDCKIQNLQSCNRSIASASVDTEGVDTAEKYEKSNSNFEIVSLKQFIRGGKKQQYLNFGVIMFDEQNEIQQLNFTHRHAHGGDGDIGSQHGKYAEHAELELQRLKQQFPQVFDEPVYPVQREQIKFEHKINLKDENATPPRKRIYPLDKNELSELKTQIQEMLETNRIEPSNGPYGAPILFAKKKDGRLRMCIDYRMLNAQTINDAFPLPRIDELLSRLDGAKVFSKLDLRDGYHQIPMSESDKQKTAFSCRYGTYQFTVMPFGLMTAPSTFQRMMNQVFFDLLDKGVVIYLDDVLIYSRDIVSHRKLLDEVFTLLQKNKLYLKDKKCHLYLEQVNFLGHVVDSSGVSMEQGKVDCVRNWPVPQSVNQVQQFLGLCNYYRKFVFRFSEIAGPLTLLTRKNQPFQWLDAQQQSFDALKQCLCTAPTLRIFDSKLKTRVICDASSVCCGAVLEQQDPVLNNWHPVEYLSKRLSSSERNYSATDREFVAIRLSLEKWRHFLIGQHFKILTDHAALTYLQSSAGVHRRNVRWLEFLSQFDFEILHIQGKQNVVADALSRIPGSECLTKLELCSSNFTLNILHVDDLPLKLCTQSVQNNVADICFLNGIISINERESFRDKLIAEQEASTNTWFLDLVKQAKSGSNTYQLRNGLLCKLVRDHFCPIVPDRSSSTIKVILSDLHSSALGGHLGRRKLLDQVQKRFYWQNMYKSVDQFCRQCTVCQQNKTSTQKPIGKLQPLENPTRCFDHVSMDFIVNLPMSSRGFDGIFTIVDRFSRLVRFIPINSNISAFQVGQVFFDQWLCKYGVPSKIISDRDPRFQSAFWQSLCKCIDSRIAMSTTYHPQTDGLTERYHRSVEQLLRCYCSSQQDLWSDYLSQCEFALNSSVADAHGMCPFEVVFGFVPTLPLDTTMPLKSHSAEELFAARNQVHSQVSTALEASSEAMKQQADVHRRTSEFAVGQKVWLSTKNLPLRLGTRKLAEKWTGPFLLEAQISAEAWRLALPTTWKIHNVFHSSQLKLVHGQPRVPDPVTLDHSDQEFEVEAIVAERKVAGRQQYLIRWKGFGQFDDTWEPVSNLKNAQEKIKQWKQKTREP